MRLHVPIRRYPVLWVMVVLGVSLKILDLLALSAARNGREDVRSHGRRQCSNWGILKWGLAGE